MKCERATMSLCDNRVLKTLKQHNEFYTHPLGLKYFTDSMYNYPMCSTKTGEKRIPNEYGIIEFCRLEFPNRGTRVPPLYEQLWGKK